MEEEGDPAEEVLTPQQREIKKATHLDWAGLRAEFTWKNLWTNRTWGNIFGHFAKVLLLSLSPTLFDMTTDALSGKTFVFGTDYMKRNVNQSDPLNANCTLIGTYMKVGDDGESYVDYTDWSCHEKDPIWGYVTLGIIYIPGIIFFPKYYVLKEGKWHAN